MVYFCDIFERWNEQNILCWIFSQPVSKKMVKFITRPGAIWPNKYLLLNTIQTLDFRLYKFHWFFFTYKFLSISC